MWNDGYSKEQPWLNYYNSYERMHCCFGDDGGDGGGGEGAAGDEAFNTSSKAARDASIEQSIGMSADQAEQVSDAVDRAQQEGIAAQSKDSSIKDSDITEQMQNVAEGGNRAAASGYTGDELGQIADANIDTDFFSDTNTLGIGAGSTSGYGSFADPFAESGVGQTSFGSYINDLKDAGAFAAQNVGITGLISAVARAAQALGKDEKDVNAQDISMVTGGQNYGGLRSDQSPIAGPTTPAFDDEYFGPAVEFDPGATYGEGAVFDPNVDFSTREDDRNIDAAIQGNTPAAGIVSAYEDAERGYGRTPIEFDAGATYGEPDPFNNYVDAVAEADAAMFGGNYAGQPDVLEVRNVDSAENIFKEIIKKPEEKAEVVPKTAMEKYFAERGTPAIPSSFQEYRSYLPPIGPAANADYRRTLALGTPRYQEPSGPNRSIATLAAAYGMTYDEAAKRFAPPSVPKPPLDKPILFAASGGGLRSLMEYS